MAYRTARRTARSSGRYTAKRAPARRAPARRAGRSSGSRQQTVRLVVEMAPANSVSRNINPVSVAGALPRRAKH